MAPRHRVPILLLTGFPGGGKTRPLARWLGEEAFAGSMVIVPEMGEVGLDMTPAARIASALTQGRG